MSEDMRVNDGGGREKLVRVDYPSNAQTPKPQIPVEKKIDQVITGEVIRRKRSPFAKLTQNFVTEDSGSVFEYLIVEVLVPAAKSLVYDIFTQGLERKLYGEAKPKSPAQRGYTNYAAKTHSSTPIRYNTGGTVTALNRTQRVNHDFSEIILEKRSDAEDVLDKLRDLIGDYGMATVNDFYDLIGLTGEFTDDKWGWRDMRTARIQPTRDGYLFRFPKTTPVA